MRVPEENKDVTYFFHLAPIHLVHVVFVQKNFKKKIRSQPVRILYRSVGRINFQILGVEMLPKYYFAHRKRQSYFG